MAFVEFENVGKTYKMGEVSIHALHDASFSVEKGEHPWRHGYFDKRQGLAGWTGDFRPE